MIRQERSPNMGTRTSTRYLSMERKWTSFNRKSMDMLNVTTRTKRRGSSTRINVESGEFNSPRCRDVIDLINDVHWQISKDLVQNYDHIMASRFKISDMVKKATRRINSENVRKM